MAHALNHAGVAVSTPDGYLRFAPHWPNALDEVPRVAAELQRVLGATAPTRDQPLYRGTPT